jgi:hypothetical protein
MELFDSRLGGIHLAFSSPERIIDQVAVLV